MRLGAKRPGSTTSFRDSLLEELLLEFSWKEDGSIEMAFHIYDALGQLVADSDGSNPLTAVLISDASGEVLLDVPAETDLPIRYRLYDRAGTLLTSSDGLRTQIFSHLKMEGRLMKHGNTPSNSAAAPPLS